MRKFLTVLMGLIGAYLISVGAFDDWNFLAGLEPTEVIRRLTFFVWLFAVFAFFAWVISELFDIY